MAGMKKAIDWYQSLDADIDYLVEEAKIDFAISLDRIMKRQNLSQAQLAKMLNKSPAYISKALSGDENFTVETMVRLAVAVNGRYCHHIVPRDSEVHWFEVANQITGSHEPQPERVWVSTKPVSTKRVNDELSCDTATAA